MKNAFFKSTLAGVAMISAMAVTTASHAADALNVVISDIRLYTNADDASSRTAIVYRPGDNIGEENTKTVNLFDAGQRAGTSFNIATPAAGTYEAIGITFDSITVVSGSINLDLRAQMISAGLLSSTGVMLLGENGIGARAVSAPAAPGLNVSATSASPLVATGSAITLPELNFVLDEADVVADSGAAISVRSLPQIIPQGRAGVDSSSRANVSVTVNTTAFSAVPAWGAGASRVTVGLFDQSLPARPLAAKVFTSPSVNGAVISEFVDAPVGTHVALAWIDADGDARLDEGEYLSPSATYVANMTQEVSGSTDIAWVGTLDTTAFRMGPRDITLTVELPDFSVTETLILNNGFNFTGIAASMTIPNDATNSVSTTVAEPITGTLAISYALRNDQSVNRNFSLGVALGANGISDTSGIYDVATYGPAGQFLDGAASLGYVGLLAAVTETAPIGGITWTDGAGVGTQGLLHVQRIPLFITHLADQATTGTYYVSLTLDLLDDGTTTSNWAASTTTILASQTVAGVGDQSSLTGILLEDPSHNTITLDNTGLDDADGTGNGDGNDTVFFNLGDN